MAGMRVVYKSPAPGVAAVMGVLERAGLHPTALDDPGPVMRYASKGTVKVRITVPEDEYRRALAAIGEWDRAAKPAVREHARQFRPSS